ncbi:uncharacterized protein LOC116296814 isoform X2 [Actinia tenebrosa]|nr:uncharacterized protein LOC116296814 isoform X2 [Actinia tenebrosa]
MRDILEYEEGSNPFEQSPLSDSSQQSTCYEPWEDFQSLSPFGADWEMEQEFFKSDFNDLDCKSQGPTLAELNNQRSTSPLINPEMERLHRIATRTEAEPTSSSRNGSHLLLKYNADERELNTENRRFFTSKNNGKAFFGEMSGGRSLPGEEDKSLKSSRELESGTQMVTSSTCTEHKDDTIELKKDPMLMRRTALSEPKSIGQTIVDYAKDIQRNHLDLSSTSSRDESASEICSSARNKEELPVIKEESADEDIDSDEDFEEPRCTNDGESNAKQRKGRRGDVEDLSPNPRRLLEIGRELNRLTKIITELKPIHSLPMSARNKSKKEKNKLASRACRLKKKAQHESNKLKLHGLELERQRLVSLIDKVKEEILHDTEGFTVSGELSNKVESLIHTTVGEQVVAGHLSAFVESVLKATANATPGYQGVDVQLNI